ncbi:uncharacterized protein [Arachis hypogaea]|uniref:Uncharacterized protein n=1 Tax=Arachis hypogaea TaxID=3818 RepID=A0A6B9V6M0_ARAHY|nr:uncharacterized protein LOC112779507 [Arachis hypogaea]QHN76907.1 uncharacterized protein DS421_19g648030 [Arachis hypogaea]
MEERERGECEERGKELAKELSPSKLGLSSSLRVSVVIVVSAVKPVAAVLLAMKPAPPSSLSWIAAACDAAVAASESVVVKQNDGQREDPQGKERETREGRDLSSRRAQSPLSLPAPFPSEPLLDPPLLKLLAAPLRCRSSTPPPLPPKTTTEA